MRRWAAQICEILYFRHQVLDPYHHWTSPPVPYGRGSGLLLYSRRDILPTVAKKSEANGRARPPGSGINPPAQGTFNMVPLLPLASPSPPRGRITLFRSHTAQQNIAGFFFPGTVFLAPPRAFDHRTFRILISIPVYCIRVFSGP